ncbi:hypothetical protein AMAG_02031 [Allomyces macrogynus ATCC 38327]|uniref:RING-type E3 ubiquitin transferase n=1 Tax=Allomyces macrogynus (strain ATCC 38327) TaxID=578462 RepID=A0A0L0S0Q6_ALLM3|nr:hypothetical protein AMAG_02031 [Allomyces macrogynus ATCC 38327]|eukprot:KNE56197.1 hypothetical protein AMAG_02031 [Allomyces macrogynus ATCC 38327]
MGDDQERMREKRLARLAALGASSPAGTSTSPASPRPQSPQAPASTRPAPPKPVAAAAPATPTAPSPARCPVSRDGSSNSLNSPSSPAAGPPKPFEEWANLALAKVFQVSLDPANPRCIPSLVDELKAERDNPEIVFRKDTDQPLLSASLVERVLVARLSLPENATRDQSLVDYLLGCYVRARDIKTNLVAKSHAADLPARVAVLDQAGFMLVNYIGIVINLPDMFPQPEPCIGAGPGEIISALLNGTVEMDFLGTLIQRATEYETKDQVVYPLFNSLAAEVRGQKVGGQWMPLFQFFQTIAGNPAVANVIAELPNFCPTGLPPKAFELGTFLGPFLRMSGFGFDDPDLIKTYFADATDRSQVDQVSGIQSLRMAVHHLQNSQYGALMAMIKASPVLRDRILHFFGAALKLNEKRSGMHMDLNTVASFGFTQNVSVALLRLAEPFMLPPYAKIGLIDPHYLRNPERKVDVAGWTKMNASEQEAAEYYQNEAMVTAKPNFISDVFYLTLGWLHIGLVRTLTFYNTYSKDLADRRKQFAQLQRDHAERFANTPQQAMSEVMLKRYKMQIDQELGVKLTMDAHVQDVETLAKVHQFYSLVAAWLIRILCTDNGVAMPYRPPVPVPFERESAVFKHLPEHVLEDITDYCQFILRFDRLLVQEPFDPMIELFIVILANPAFVKNPYLKAKCCEVLFFMTYHRELMLPLSSHPASMAHLIPALLRLYVDVEITGVSSQFYDKLNIRYNISHILKCLWNMPVHRSKVKDMSRHDVFVRFVNMMMNDLRYLLDEALTKLAEIHVLQDELEAPDFAQRPVQEQQEKRQSLAAAERQATSYMSLGNQTLDTFSYISKEIPDPFLTPEIIDRLAAMLDFNLAALVGPKCTELKVRDPEKYRFQPKQLLTDLVDVYLNLAHAPEFVRAVARDGRSYRREWFQKAAGVMVRTGAKASDEIERLAAFVDQVDAAVKADEEEDVELGEIPDEFLDPLMYTLMEDPVILPTSGQTVDRATITGYLLGEKRDPFNRKELAIGDVIPNVELKAQIEAFKKEARAKARQVREMDQS